MSQPRELRKEKDFQAHIVDLAMMSGWLVHGERPGRTAMGWRTPVQGIAGFCDLVLVKEQTGRLIFVELKSSKGKLTPLQERWLAALRKSGAEVYVWREQDWPEIVATLTDTRKGVS